MEFGMGVKRGVSKVECGVESKVYCGKCSVE